MTVKLEIYRCGVCGNIVEVLHAGVGELVCCDQPMEKQVEHTSEELKEKHLPVMGSSGDGIRVRVGSVPHPMEEKHYIEWVQVISGESVYRKFLSPGSDPEALFGSPEEPAAAREYCNVHGLWKTSPGGD